MYQRRISYFSSTIVSPAISLIEMSQSRTRTLKRRFSCTTFLSKSSQKDKYETYTLQEFPPVTAYRLLIGCIVPRPIALVTTVDREKIDANVQEVDREKIDIDSNVVDRENQNVDAVDREKIDININITGDSKAKTKNQIISTDADQEKAADVFNCAPYSFFNIISYDPPLISISIQRAQGLKKDTLINIEKNREFVVNIISDHFLEKANITSGDFPSYVNEISEAGLTTLSSKAVDPPRIRESFVQMECLLYEKPRVIVNEKEEETAEVVLGKILHLHVNEKVIKKAEKQGRVDEILLEKLKPVGRAGGNEYTLVNFPTIDIPRPKV